MQRFAFASALLLCAVLACKSDDDDGSTNADSSEAGPGSNTAGSNTNSTTNGSNTNSTTNGSNTNGESGEPGDCDFDVSFEGNAGAWPSPWEVAGGAATADVVDGRGRLTPMTNNYSLARMYAPLDCADAEVTFAFEFTDGSSQGIGVYVRQNGGHLQHTDPPGTGYAVFIENFRNPAGIGGWVEVGGVEMQLQGTVAFPVEANVLYRSRVRVTQGDASTTRLQARMWRDGEDEPDTWQVERSDQTPHLQSAGGGLAIDSYSSRTSGAAADLFIDDIVMTAAE